MDRDDLEFLTAAAGEVANASGEGDAVGTATLIHSVQRRCGDAGLFAVAWMLAGVIAKLSPAGAVEAFVSAIVEEPEPEWASRFIAVRSAGDDQECARMFFGHHIVMMRRMYCLAGMAGGIVAAAMEERESWRVGDLAADVSDPGDVSAPPASGAPGGDPM